MMYQSQVDQWPVIGPHRAQVERQPLPFGTIDNLSRLFDSFATLIFMAFQIPIVNEDVIDSTYPKNEKSVCILKNWIPYTKLVFLIHEKNTKFEVSSADIGYYISRSILKGQFESNKNGK